MPDHIAACRTSPNMGQFALEYFRKQDRQAIDVKVRQDFVSKADYYVERTGRAALAVALPDGGIVPEERMSVLDSRSRI